MNNILGMQTNGMLHNCTIVFFLTKKDRMSSCRCFIVRLVIYFINNETLTLEFPHSILEAFHNM